MTTELNIQIDWADLDLFGHVNNVAFFRYIQASRVRFCEQAGLTSLNEQGKLSFMVASSQCQFKKPLRYPGQITTKTKANCVKNSSFELSYLILDQEGNTAAEGLDVIVLYDHHQKTKVPASETLKSELLK